MKQIEEYVNNVYRDVKGNEKEIQELKLEMNNHLLESVQGLKSEGKSEREAINVAIDRFGKENELRSILGQLFQIQKTFGKRLLYIGLGIFLLSIIIFVYTLIPANGLNNEQTSIADEILAIVPKEGQLSKSTREEIESLIRNAKFTIEKVVVKSYSTGNEIVYEYGMYGNSNSGKLYSVYFKGTPSNSVYIEVKNYSFLGTIIVFIGGTSFVLLFAIWAIIKAYHNRRAKLFY